MYDFEEERVLRIVKTRKAKRVILQFPEGLLRYASGIAERIESNTGAEVVVSADPCYGACDLALEHLKLLDGDLIIHYGHAEIPGLNNNRVVFVEAPALIDVKPSIYKALKILRDEERLGLLATIQHVRDLPNVKTLLERFGKTVYIGKSGGRVAYDGQVLGCDFTAAKSVSSKVDGFIVVSGGNFHGLGVRMKTGKRSVVADPFLNEARDMEDLAKLTFKRRWMAISKFSQCKSVGVVVSLKIGQLAFNLARKFKRLLEDSSRRCVLISVREITPENLGGLTDIEGFVNTGCPRIPIEDQLRFRRPILNPEEVLISLGMVDWEDYGKVFLERSI